MSKPTAMNEKHENLSWRARWYEVIFEADTPAGKLFDVLLLIAILLSVLVVMCESVEAIRKAYPKLLVGAEWFFTLLFTLEYGVRIICARRPKRYIFSFYGIVDLLAILPTYVIALPIFEGGPSAQRLAVIRAIRLLRVFRIFKLAHMLSEASALRQAIWAARAKIAVFLSFVLIAVVIVGSAMHLIEGGRVDSDGQQIVTGFDSIPESMYWAIVTMTTVGYGDVSPTTGLGKALAACMMILGYCMIIVPTGIVSAELAHAGGKSQTTQVCPECMGEGHAADAVHCKYCGAKL
ncbi:Cyclic nucleotide-gated potassium channel [Symmachiella macrocystis]|uniref:Cyclic nucleotide-gated potassium channel n=1 Tax=Symmachiella macrocystis TaxID=2527985 RepID=A0A5C6B964_9PLAN|nr:ion transporter [Symmachiella macrocystis]TWU08815.1 Cyclic nucleotide-gated potassium channel [Symmachiella macrocystis]